MNNETQINPCDIDWGLTPLHNKMLEILKYIDGFCENNSIQYCLAYGSALGAARHQGFIPWDDDVDIYMTAEGYDKFRSAFQQNGDKKKYYLQELGAVDGKVTMAKLRMNKTTCIEPLYQNYDMHQGIYIDIFILFSAPNGEIQRRIMNFANQYLVLKELSNRHYSQRKAYIPVLYLLRKLPHNFMRKWAYEKLYGYSKESRDYYDVDMRTFSRSFYPKEYIFPARRMPFEGCSLNVPAKLDEYLTKAYGDYLKIPSYESVLRSQHAGIWKIDEDFRNYAPNISNFRDETETL